jgi:hypothetical protein
LPSRRCGRVAGWRPRRRHCFDGTGRLTWRGRDGPGTARRSRRAASPARWRH